jgi:plastocyanin
MLRTLCLILALVMALPGSAMSQAVLNKGKTTHVEARDHVFVPENVTINRGETVTWTNTGQSFHTVTSGEECRASGIFNAELPPGEQFSHTFESAGAFPYFCVPHCAMGMTGTVTVVE